MESVEPISVANLRVNQLSQINEDTVEPSVAAQDIDPVAYNAWPNFTPRSGFILGLVQLIRPGNVLSLAVAHSTARPNRQPLKRPYNVIQSQIVGLYSEGIRSS